jgi:peptide/nickel transport system substrate-binding protein
MDPHQATSSQDIPWLLPIYASIFSYAKDGSVVGGLAETWEQTAQDLTLHLRDGLTFHDGTPLNADAIVVNLERAKNLETSAVKGELTSVASVEALDDSTVVLHLSEADAALPAKLADRAGMIISPAALNDGTNLSINPVGAGPWKLVEYAAGDHLTAERFDNYYDIDSVKVKTLTIRLIDDDDTRLNAVRAGEVDIAQISASQVQLAQTDSALTVRTDPSVALDHIGLNIATPPFDNPLVREAINYAIDREALMAGLYHGNGIIAWQPFPPGSFANDPALENKFPFNPDKARSLLTEAGYPNGFTFDFKTNNQPFRVQASEAIAGMLADVGITANIIPLEGPALLDEFYYQLTVPAYFTPWGGRADPSQTLDNIVGPTGLNNPAKITNPELTKLLDQARTSTDQAERGEFFRKAVDNIMSESRMIPLVFPGVSFAVRDNVIGYSTGVTGKADFLGVAVSGSGK